MSSTTTDVTMQTFQYHKEVEIAAPPAVTFEAILAEIGPESEMPGGKPFPFVLEAFPGGRWYRDLGDHAGHLWGHVQVIKPPKLLEICGPMMMSFPSANHLQYRLAENGSGTRLSVTHRAYGLLPPGYLDDMPEGWEHGLKRIAQIAARLNKH